MGGTPNYWNILPEGYLAERNITITLVNLPSSVKQHDEGHFRFLERDACKLRELTDQSFDIVHSNSVIKHVGVWSSGWPSPTRHSAWLRTVFVQTPNFWFPVEPHYMTPFIHWLPKPTQVWWVMQMRLGHKEKATTVGEAVLTIESIHLLNRKMMEALFPGTCIWTERVLGLPKSFVAIR